MSPKLILGLLCLGGFGLGVGGSYGWEKVTESTPAIPQERKLASMQISGKHQAPLLVQIQAPDEIPLDDNTEVKLKAFIVKKAENLGGIQYTWHLPEGVTTSDNINGTIENMNPNVNYEVTLYVRGFSKMDKKIVSLEASVYQGTQVLGASSVISSRPEDSMEYIAPIMADVSPNSPTRSQIQR